VLDIFSLLLLSQQLILTTPEFHTTNLVRKTGLERVVPAPPPMSNNTYKAIVYVLFGGGCDSFNMLVPYTCSIKTDNTTLWDEYLDLRQEVALNRVTLKVLNRTTTNQACETFAVHPKFETAQKLFNDGDLLFFGKSSILFLMPAGA